MKIKETINGFPKLSTAKLIDIVKEYDIVSFDIFDTLIKRDVYKEYDVFDLVEKKYNSTYGDNILNFKDIRIEAEKNARKISDKEETKKCLFFYLKLLQKVEVFIKVSYNLLH